MALKNLLSGSDVRGYALKGEDGSEPNLTNDVAYKIAVALPQWYKNKYGKMPKTIAIGRDSRLTGEALLYAFASGLTKTGIEVLDTGLSTTPSMFMITKEPNFNVDAAVMITASHMPKDRNGIKIVTGEGGLSPEEVLDILNIAEAVSVETVEPITQEVDFLTQYAGNLVNFVREKTGETTPLEGARIVVDAGNGSGGYFAYNVLEPLGANIEGSRYLEPNGNFPNHIPNPEDEEAIESIEAAVLDNKADMGIIFDTDVDRSAIVDEKGKPINKSAFIAFIASLLLDENPGATIVTDSVTSNGLTDFIEKKGGKHYRYKRGYKNVIDKAKELNEEGQNTVLAMETSGHGAVKDNYFLDDGSYLAVLSLLAFINAKKNNLPISEYLDDYEYPLEESEIRLTINKDNFREVGQKVLEDFEAFAKTQPGWTIVTPSYEGVRVDCNKDNGDGWILIRQSLHEPKLAINIESNSVGGAEVIEKRFNEFVSKYDFLS